MNLKIMESRMRKVFIILLIALIAIAFFAYTGGVSPLTHKYYCDIGTGRIEKRVTFLGIPIEKSSRETQLSQWIKDFELEPLLDSGVIFQNGKNGGAFFCGTGYAAHVESEAFLLVIHDKLTKAALLEIIRKTNAKHAAKIRPRDSI